MFSLRLLARVLPSSCALCGQLCAGVVCDGCRGDAVIIRSRCHRCANPLPAADAAAGRACGACVAAPPAFETTIAGADYQAPLDQLVLQLKFGGVLPLAAWFAALLRDQVLRQARADLPDVLVPVPLGRRRLVERGFNQALEVARPLSRMLGVPVEAQLAARIVETAPQSALPPLQRGTNVCAAFAATAGVRGLHVGVVDDVMTSGRTLDAVAHALKQAGALRVSNYVVARTPPK